MSFVLIVIATVWYTYLHLLATSRGWYMCMSTIICLLITGILWITARLEALCMTHMGAGMELILCLVV